MSKLLALTAQNKHVLKTRLYIMISNLQHFNFCQDYAIKNFVT